MKRIAPRRSRIEGSLMALCIFLLIFPSTTHAARPLSTDDAGTVEKGHFEVEGGYEYVSKADEESNWAVVLKYGLLERWDVGIEVPYQCIDKNEDDDVNGISDIVICSKFHFLDENENLPSVAVSFSTKTNTGDEDKELGSGAWDYGVVAVLTKEIKGLVFHSNVGYTYVDVAGEEDHEDLLSYGVATEYPINEALNIVGELLGETNFENSFNDNPFSALLGLAYAVTDAMRVDFGVGIGISKASPDYSITTGITLAI